VTHSPQVAAFGNRHFRIQKETVGDKTLTSAIVLSGAQRREEIARMLAGTSVTDASRAAADALLSERKTS